MKKKYLIILLGVLVVAASMAMLYFILSRDSYLTDDEIKKMHDCDRVTADVRATDIYCVDPDLYREHDLKGEALTPISM